MSILFELTWLNHYFDVNLIQFYVNFMAQRTRSFQRLPFPEYHRASVNFIFSHSYSVSPSIVPAHKMPKRSCQWVGIKLPGPCVAWLQFQCKSNEPIISPKGLVCILQPLSYSLILYIFRRSSFTRISEENP